MQLNHIIYTLVLPTCCKILYLLCLLLHVSALKLGHPQGATKRFDVIGYLRYESGKLHTTMPVFNEITMLKYC